MKKILSFCLSSILVVCIITSMPFTVSAYGCEHIFEIEYKEPTCFEEGYEIERCPECGLIKSEITYPAISCSYDTFGSCQVCGDCIFTYNLNTDGGSYSVTECHPEATGELIIPDVYNNLPVTEIAENAFKWCQSIESIEIGDSLTNIGNYAFSNCTSLTSVVVGNNVSNIGDYAFEWCENLSSVKLGNSVNTIGDYAFQECTNLTSINIPPSIENIGYSAFGWCDNLAYVQLPETINEICEGSFRCSGLKSIVIPEGVDRIGDYAFESCDNLISVTLPKSLKSIGQYAFNYCNFTTITIPEGIEKIEEYAFSCCYGLTEIEIPESVTKIEKSVFDHCGNLRKVSLGNGVTSIGQGSFAFCRELSEISISDSVVSIDSSAFYSCNLDSVVIPKTVKTIGEKAFGYYLDSSIYKVCKNNDFIIYGIKETAAGTYANENEFKFIDLNHTHTASSWITDKKATVNKAGSKHKECTECGKILETETIKQLKCDKTSLKKIENTADGVKITWGSVKGADSYAVYRKTGSNGKYSKIGTTSKTDYTDKKAKSGKKYYYYVKAVNEAGSSDASKSKSIIYLADTTLSTPKSTKSGVTLKWKKVTGADGYQVYRKTGSGSYSKIATVKGNSKVNYTDNKAKKGKTYTYKIKAYKSKTYKSKTTSAYSNAKKIKDKY